MSDKHGKIDPRFDPAFQRGFDPTIPIEELAPDPLPSTRSIASRPVIPPVHPVAARAEAAARDVADSGSEVDGADGSATEPAADPSPSRNPFLLLLGIIAVALVAVGIWLFIRSGDAFNGNQVRSQGGYMSLDATIHAAPFIALLGAATAIGVVFVFAANWRRRR